ncbi:unnamed protein product [Brassicogethes aeneus]|uniref:Cuticle protein n=1 Tax=Brassicogethes aeneus TaxID=1431903 RepID=A0A9P0B0F9_BRAAE|nr:unnamed protein product [Brassicogethes aeneus]
MAFKFVLFAAFVAAASASPIGFPLGLSSYSTAAHVAPAYTHTYAAPVAHVAYAPVQKTIIAEAPANYDFGYSVNDPHTGDSKSAQESRHGDSVQGSYSLIDADGTKRTVEYTADEHNGFNAVVHKEPAHVAKVALAAPVAYAAPVTHYAHAAPVQSYYHH